MRTENTRQQAPGYAPNASSNRKSQAGHQEPQIQKGGIPMEMTRERLEDYRSKKDEIKELRYKLAHLGKGDSMMGADTIFDYQTGFPRPQAVVGVDREKMNRLETRYKKRIDELEAECAEVELWIEEIPDSRERSG